MGRAMHPSPRTSQKHQLDQRRQAAGDMTQGVSHLARAASRPLRRASLSRFLPMNTILQICATRALSRPSLATK